ncbi:MAG TPA: MFS transporter [Thermoanaerobaculia bacterium]|nr:MFS transporter [Thermoanaerobaculia bacterium]
MAIFPSGRRRTPGPAAAGVLILGVALLERPGKSVSRLIVFGALRPYVALRHRDFRRLVATQLLSATGSQMQVVAINWHVYLLTRSPLALGFVGLTRVVPIIAFSLWGGLLADRLDRRKLMATTQSAMTVVALVLAAVTFLHRESLWIIYALNALSAAAVAFDGPSRQALLPRLVPAEELSGALSLNFAAFQIAMISGPALSGIIIAGTGAGMVPRAPLPPGVAIHTTGLAWIYLLNALSFLGVIGALLTMRTSGKVIESQAPSHPLHALQEGLRFVFTTPLIVWTMALDFLATFFSGAMSLLPIFADQILKVGASGYGFLVSAPAVGALAGSVWTSVRPLPARQGKVFLWAVGAYGAATVVFGLSRSFPLTLAALAATGLADAISTVIRQTLRQLITPDALRGRMTSVNMIFFMGGPQLGEVEAGVVAALFGATASVVSGGIATIGIAAAVAWKARALRDYGGPRASGPSVRRAAESATPPQAGLPES